MKAKTREKLAVRGLGPLVRPGRPGRGRRGVLAPQRGAGASDAGGGSAAEGAQPAVREMRGYGEVMDPPAGSVRERVRLRPAVREGLDIEAERLGMTREGLCRFVLEEVARKAVDGSVSAVVDVQHEPDIPSGYVGRVEDEAEEVSSTGADPVDAGGDGRQEADGQPLPGAGPLAERALLRVGRRSAGDAAPVRSVRGMRRLRRFGGRVRARGGWVAALALVLLAVLSAASAAVSWRYEVAGAAGDGVYVVDRWRGAVWRCGAAGGGRPPACAQAVFRPPATGGDVAYLGRRSIRARKGG